MFIYLYSCRPKQCCVFICQTTLKQQNKNFKC